MFALESVNGNENSCVPLPTRIHMQTHRVRLSTQLNFVLLNYRSRWKLLEGSSLSFLRISALLYKAMQMRGGLRDPSAIPVAHIKWEHDTVFLGVQTRRKRDELCWEDSLDAVQRLNSVVHWHCLSDANYIWLPLPTGLVLQLQVCSQTLRLRPHFSQVCAHSLEKIKIFAQTQFPGKSFIVNHNLSPE